MPDWIDTFLSSTEGVSPEPFRLWSAISAITSALERRVYTITDKGILYPNLYILPTGSSGSGKSLMVNEIREIWKSVDGLYVGPDSPTRSSILKRIMESTRVVPNGAGTPHIFTALSIGCREFGTMFSKSETTFLAELTDIFDNPDSYDAPRTSVESYKLERPTVNILAGVTPAALYETFPEVAWSQGFTSRLVFIYSEPGRRGESIFAKRRKTGKDKLSSTLNEIFHDIQGEFTWSDEAAEFADLWCRTEGMPPIPDYSRLLTYNERRESLFLKLSMVSAISAEHSLEISLSDAERAKHWMLDAERRMPDVFRSMSTKTDAQLIKDLHFDAYTKWNTVERRDRKPLPESYLYEWLKHRVPSERIPHVIDVSVRAGVFAKGHYPGEYIPQPFDKFDLREI